MEELSSIVGGNPPPVKVVHIEKADAKSFKVKTKVNTGYIVCAVLMDENSNVLMMQEAKTSCHGLWYLPAGRMEKNENLQDAVKREVLEETGLQFEPSTLIYVEMGRGTWYRYTFTGKVTGGRLKTLKEKDKESLQAKWIPWEDIKTRKLQLRCGDTISLIEVLIKYNKLSLKQEYLPTIRPYDTFLHRIILVCQQCGKSSSSVLFHKEIGKKELPVCHISPTDFSIQVSVFSLIQISIGSPSDLGNVSMCGLLSIEHGGGVATVAERDGYCMSTLWKFTSENRPTLKSDFYEWVPVTEGNDELQTNISLRLNKQLCIPFVDV